MKKIIVEILIISIFLCACTNAEATLPLDDSGPTVKKVQETDNDYSSDKISLCLKTYDEYAKDISFNDLDDESLMRYVEDRVYSEILSDIDNSEYYVENIETVYISKEYIEELEYNSRANIYFGYTLEELENQFQGKKFIFTLNDEGETIAIPFEENDNTYNKVLKNIVIGAGVILLCITVSAVTAGVGAPAASMIFAMSAKSASTMAISSGVISGVASGVIKGIETGDYSEALKTGAITGSEGFMWGAITGAIGGGAYEALALKGATSGGLTMNEVAMIQKESKYPLDVLKQFSSIEQYNVCKDAGLTAEMVNGKTALIRKIDWNYIDQTTGLTNAERARQGLAALDSSGNAYELHHIGQHADSTLAILTKEEHRLGDSYSIWHELVGESEIDRIEFDKIRKAFWQELGNMLS